jgi:signal transduction histidine kinase
VDLLQAPHTQEQGQQYLDVLSRQSARMKKLVEDLMDMSKASSGNLQVNVTTLDSSEVISQALGEFSDKLTSAQLTPVFQAPEAPILMRADGRHTWRVLSNLLSNTVKYAMPGTRLYIDLVSLPGSVQISLKNISAEPLNVSAEELTERFVRGDASRNTEGSGLGLNIAKSLMELQQGNLELLVDGDLFKVTLTFPAE